MRCALGRPERARAVRGGRAVVPQHVREPRGPAAACRVAADPALVRPAVEHRLPDESSLIPAGQDVSCGRRPGSEGRRGQQIMHPAWEVQNPLGLAGRLGDAFYCCADGPPSFLDESSRATAGCESVVTLLSRYGLGPLAAARRQRPTRGPTLWKPLLRLASAAVLCGVINHGRVRTVLE